MVLGVCTIGVVAARGGLASGKSYANDGLEPSRDAETMSLTECLSGSKRLRRRSCSSAA